MPSLSGSSRGRARARPKGDRSRRTQREYHLQFAAGFHHRPARHGRWSTSIARCTCTPRSPTDFPAGTVDFDQGRLERNEQGHPIIAGAYVGPGNRSDRRHAAYWGEWSQMNRRGLLQRAAVAIPSLSGMWSWLGPTRVWGAARPHSRVRPGDPAWPSEASWNRLSRDVGGRLVKVQLAARRLHGRAVERGLRSGVQGLEEPVLPRRRGWVDAVPRLGRRLDVEAKRVRGGRPDDGRCRRRRQFRPRAQFAGRREGRRPQLPGHIQRGRLSADLDARDECAHRARRVRRCRVRGTPRAAAGGHGRGGRDLGPGLRCRHDEGGPLRPGRRLPDRGRRRA